MRRTLWIATAILLLTLAGCSVEQAATGDTQQAGGDGAKAQTWHKVASLSGNTDKAGPTFKLRGGEQKMVYRMTGATMPIMGVYLMAKGTTVDEDGGFPEVMPDKAGRGKTMLYKDAGRYYLAVTAANCTWSVTLYEKR